MQQDRFEQRLGSGLQRWAASGEPTLDLEAYVKAQSRKPRRWVRWMSIPAVAAAVVIGLSATFPKWAGAASGWPLVGPAVTRIIMKDTGLKWAYDAGLIQGTLAEAKHGDVTFRIIGVAATDLRTDLIYEITGLPKELNPAVKAGETLDGRPVMPYPEMRITKVEGTTSFFWNTPVPENTPIGMFGRVLTSPLGVEAGEISLNVHWPDGAVSPLTLQVSRKEAGQYFRSVPINRAQERDGVTVTVDSVVYAPQETFVRYRVQAEPAFHGSWAWSGREYSTAVIVAGQPVYSHQFIAGEWSAEAYPVASGAETFVVPAAVKGVEANLVWPLETGATQEVLGATVRLKSVQQTPGHLEVAWDIATTGRFVGIADFEAVDAAGNVAPLDRTWGTGSPDPSGRTHMDVTSKLPDGFTAVAVRARQYGIKVDGPWRFELPQK